MPIAIALIVTSIVVLAAHTRQGVEDPAIRAAVERFFATQEAEDAEGYVALWSSKAQRPREQLKQQLQFIFDNGDDKFSDITVTAVTTAGDRVRVRVTAMRVRTSARNMRPDGTPMSFTSRLSTSLTFVREGDALKLLNEGLPEEDLAANLLEAATAADRDALLAAEPDLVTDRLTLTLSRRGDMAAQQGQYPAAERIYERVLELARRLGNRKAEGEALQNVANARYYQRNFAGALDAYEQRLTIERETSNDEGIVGSLLGIATIKYSSLEYSVALSSYEEALAIQVRLQDEANAAVTLISTGNVRYLQADYEGAIADYRRSRDLQRKLTNVEGEARALQGLGRVHTAQGDFAAALEAYAGVLAEAQSRGHRPTMGHAIQSIGEVHFRLGNLEVARPLFDESRAHFEADKDFASVGRVWHAAALTDLVASRFAAAEQAYLKSGAACETARENDCVARAIVGQAFAQASQLRFADAIVTYGKAIAAFSALKKVAEAARAEIGLSQAHFGKGEFEIALMPARRARELATTLGDDDVLWRARVAEARALRRMPSPDRALTAARAAVTTVQRMVDASLQRPADRVAADSVAAYAILAVLQAEAGDAAGAFLTMEQRRTHAMRVVLATNERDIARGMTPDERQEERKLAADLVALQKQLDVERMLPRPDGARVTRLQQSVSVAAQMREAQQQLLFTRLPDLRAWRGLLRPSTIEDAARALPADDTVLVEFLIDDEDLLVVVGSKIDGAIAVRAYQTPIARQALAEAVARAVEPAVLRSVEGWRKTSAELVSAIPADVLSRMSSAARVIIVPDDMLWRVPFEALPIEGGVLADRAAVVYASSVSALVNAPAMPPDEPSLTLLAVRSPELPAGTLDRVKLTSPAWTVRSLEEGEAEIRAIAMLVEEPVLVVVSGASASETTLRAQAPAASVLHVAAPFRVNSASPLFSSVLLAAEPAKAAELDPSADGILEAREVMNLTLRARVAVLSDGAAASMRDAAAAIETIQWAWRAAGVPSLVLPRWAADAGASGDFLAELHNCLRSGEPADSALQGARLAVRAREATRAPWFWAGWILVGFTITNP